MEFAANVGDKVAHEDVPVALGWFINVGLVAHDVIGDGDELPLAVFVEMQGAVSVVAFDVDCAVAAVERHVVVVEAGV